MSAAEHKAAAAEYLEIARKAHPSAIDHALRVAQVHATLALAEQQRIANLIAWLGDGPLSTVNELREGQIAIQRQIVDGLGLA